MDGKKKKYSLYCVIISDDISEKKNKKKMVGRKPFSFSYREEKKKENVTAILITIESQ